MKKSSSVSVEFTTFNFIKLGFDRDKEKDMKDIPAGTAIKSILKMCMCFFAFKVIIFDKITAILTFDISDISLQY